jgi:pilus assembly protein CpaB
MIIRVLLFVLMATGVVGFGTVAWIATRAPAEAHTAAAAAAAAQAPKLAVLVAAHDLLAGSLLKPEDIKAEQIAAADMRTGVQQDTKDNRDALIGAMLRRPLAKGESLRTTDVMTTHEHGFLAAVIKPGMRAISVGVDAVSGTAGLIWPGDRVDVILLQSIEDKELPLGRRVAAETVLSNARVVAIDKQLVQGAVPGAADASVARTVTLEVTAEQAERVSVAGRIGHLSLTVRAADANAGQLIVAARQPPVFASDVSHALVGQQKRPKVNTIKVFPGAGKSEEFKF